MHGHYVIHEIIFFYTFRKLVNCKYINATDMIFAGWERFGNDIKLMLGSRPALWWRIMWQGVTPLIVTVSIV